MTAIMAAAVAVAAVVIHIFRLNIDGERIRRGVDKKQRKNGRRGRHETLFLRMTGAKN
jgi:hypothetical protein